MRAVHGDHEGHEPEARPLPAVHDGSFREEAIAHPRTAAAYDAFPAGEQRQNGVIAMLLRPGVGPLRRGIRAVADVRVLREPGDEPDISFGGVGPLIEPLVHFSGLEQRGRLPSRSVVEDIDLKELAKCLAQPIVVEVRFAAHELRPGGQLAASPGVDHRLERLPRLLHPAQPHLGLAECVVEVGDRPGRRASARRAAPRAAGTTSFQRFSATQQRSCSSRTDRRKPGGSPGRAGSARRAANPARPRRRPRAARPPRRGGTGPRGDTDSRGTRSSSRSSVAAAAGQSLQLDLGPAQPIQDRRHQPVGRIAAGI